MDPMGIGKYTQPLVPSYIQIYLPVFVAALPYPLGRGILEKNWWHCWWDRCLEITSKKIWKLEGLDIYTYTQEN